MGETVVVCSCILILRNVPEWKLEMILFKIVGSCLFKTDVTYEKITQTFPEFVSPKLCEYGEV